MTRAFYCAISCIFFSAAFCASLARAGSVPELPPELPEDIIYQDVTGRDFQSDLKIVAAAMRDEGFQFVPLDGKGEIMLTWNNGMFTSIDYKNVAFIKFNTAVNDPRYEDQMYHFDDGFFFHGIAGDQIPYMLYLVGIDASDASKIVSTVQSRLGRASKIRGLKRILNTVENVMIPSANAGCMGANIGVEVHLPHVPGAGDDESQLEQAVLNCAQAGFPPMWKQLEQHFFPDLLGKTWESLISASPVGTALDGYHAVANAPHTATKIGEALDGVGRTMALAYYYGIRPDEIINAFISPLGMVTTVMSVGARREASYIAQNAHRPQDIGPLIQGQFAAMLTMVRTAIHNVKTVLKQALSATSDEYEQWLSQPLEVRAKTICGAIGYGVGRESGNILGTTLGTVGGAASWLLIPVAGEVTGATELVVGLVKAVQEGLKAFPWGARAIAVLAKWLENLQREGKTIVHSFSDLRTPRVPAAAALNPDEAAAAATQAAERAAAREQAAHAAEQARSLSSAKRTIQEAGSPNLLDVMNLPNQDELVNALGNDSQLEWIESWKEEHGNEPRMKPDDHGGQVDITKITDFAKLPKAVRESTAASFNAAIDAVYDFIRQGHRIAGDLSGTEETALQEVRHAAGVAIHKKWLELNGSWAPKELKVPFDDLTKIEQDKDLKFVDLVLDRLEEMEAHAIRKRALAGAASTVVDAVAHGATAAKNVVETPVNWTAQAVRALSNWVDGVIPGVTGRTLANIVRSPAKMLDVADRNIAQGLARWSGKAEMLAVRRDQQKEVIERIEAQIAEAQRSKNTTALNNARARMTVAQRNFDLTTRTMDYQNLFRQTTVEQGRYEAQQIAEAAREGKTLTKEDLSRIRMEGLRLGVENQSKNLLMSARAMRVLEENPGATLDTLKGKLAQMLHDDWRDSLQATTPEQVKAWIQEQLHHANLSLAERDKLQQILGEANAGTCCKYLPRLKNTAGRVAFSPTSSVGDVVDIANTSFSALPTAWQTDNLNAAGNILNTLGGLRSSSGALNSTLYRRLADIPLDDPNSLQRVETLFSIARRQGDLSQDPLVIAAGAELRAYTTREGIAQARNAAKTVILINILADGGKAVTDLEEDADINEHQDQ